MTSVQEFTLYLLTLSILGLPWCIYNLLELLSGRNPFFTKGHQVSPDGTIESVYPINQWKKKKYRGVQA